MSDTRRYIKRPWRVPKDRGASEYLAALTTKALVKHGWPARYAVAKYGDGFNILHDKFGHDLPDDFAQAVRVAVRIIARTYRVELDEHIGSVLIHKRYRVTSGGHLREEK